MKKCDRGPYVGKARNKLCMKKAFSLIASYPNQFNTFVAQNNIPSKESCGLLFAKKSEKCKGENLRLGISITPRIVSIQEGDLTP